MAWSLAKAAKTIFRVHDLHDCTWVVVCGQCGYLCQVHVSRRTVNVPGDCHHRQMQKQKLKTNYCGACVAAHSQNVMTCSCRGLHML